MGDEVFKMQLLDVICMMNPKLIRKYPSPSAKIYAYDVPIICI